MKSLGKKVEYPTEPSIDILETFEDEYDSIYLVPFQQTRDEFTSLCPITKQPDFARIEIIYIPKKLMIESKSLKLYLFSFRNHGAFHESVTKRIFDDIWKKIDPIALRVTGDFAPRGGIAIKPIVFRMKSDLNEEQEKTIAFLYQMYDIQKLSFRN